MLSERFENQRNSNSMEKSLDLRHRHHAHARFQPKRCARRHHTEDRISSLPDDILMIILSFLTFEQVMKTSLLSRRWLNAWVYTPVLDFQEPLPKNMNLILSRTGRQEFVNWVNGILPQHKGEFLKEFRIVCYLDKCNQKDIDKWLNFALAKKVEHLEFNLLAARQFACNTRANYVFPDLFPNSNDGKIRCLRSLSLKKVDVSEKDVHFLLLNCPFLERLVVVGSMKLVNVVISDPTLVLKYLCIKICHKLKVISISNFNLVSLDIHTVHDLTLGYLPMLVDLYMYGTHPTISHTFPQVSCYSQLESLTLDVGCKLKSLPRISNLYQLLKLKRLVIKGAVFDDESLTFLNSIITALPQLEEFVFVLDRGMAIKEIIRDLWRCDSSVKSKSLKVFEFVGYSGLPRDHEFIMELVENAVGLEKITLDPSDDVIAFLPTSHKSRKAKKRERKIRNTAMKQYDALKESIPPHVDIIIR